MVGSIAGSNVMAVVVYVYLLNAKLEPGADNFAIKQKIGIVKSGLMPVSAGTIRIGVVQPDFI